MDGQESLLDFLGLLPKDFAAAVIATHGGRSAEEPLQAAVTARHPSLMVRPASDGQPLSAGLVVVGPPDRQVLLGTNEQIRLVQVRDPSATWAPEQPSVDLLLSTLAVTMGRRAFAVLLTGGGQVVGRLGLHAVRSHGGCGVVVEPRHGTLPGSQKTRYPASESPRSLHHAASIVIRGVRSVTRTDG